MSDGEDVSSGTSELRDLEFKLFHNLADLQASFHTPKINDNETTSTTNHNH